MVDPCPEENENQMAARKYLEDNLNFELDYEKEVGYRRGTDHWSIQKGGLEAYTSRGSITWRMTDDELSDEGLEFYDFLVGHRRQINARLSGRTPGEDITSW